MTEAIERFPEWAEAALEAHEQVTAGLAAWIDEWEPPTRPDLGKRRTDAELLADLLAAAAGG